MGRLERSTAVRDLREPPAAPLIKTKRTEPATAAVQAAVRKSDDQYDFDLID